MGKQIDALSDPLATFVGSLAKLETEVVGSAAALSRLREGADPNPLNAVLASTKEAAAALAKALRSAEGRFREYERRNFRQISTSSTVAVPPPGQKDAAVPPAGEVTQRFTESKTGQIAQKAGGPDFNRRPYEVRGDPASLAAQDSSRSQNGETIQGESITSIEPTGRAKKAEQPTTPETDNSLDSSSMRPDRKRWWKPWS